MHKEQAYLTRATLEITMECCNGTLENFWNMCPDQSIFFGALISALGVSMALNIYWCASRHCSGKKKSKDSTRSQTSRQMEDNPIYGNIALQTTQPAFRPVFSSQDTESSITSSVRRDQRRINAVSQDCYANLSLQRALLGSEPSAPLGPSSPDSEKDLGEAEVRSDVSELYASVQTRAKILQSPDSEEEYANHL